VTRALADASSIILLVKHADPSKLADIAPNVTTLDLASYEAGNAIWKQAKLLKILSEGDARAAHEAIVEFISHTSIVRAEALDHREAMRVALDQRIAYYDACYVVAARSLRLPLATEDRKLAGSKGGQKVIGWKQLVSE